MTTARPVGFDADALRAELASSGPATAFPGPPPAAMADYVATYGLPASGDVTHECGIVEAAGYRVFCQRFVPAAPRGHVLLVHGLFDHAGIWPRQIEWALARDLAVVLFDLPGHGLTSGARTRVDDFEHYVDVLEAVLVATTHALPRPFLAAGHSTGCSVLMQALLDPSRRGFRPDDLLLFAPLVRPGRDRLLRLALPLVAALRTALPRTPTGNTTDPAFNAFRAHGDPLQPQRLETAWLRAMTRWSARFDDLGTSDVPAIVIQGTEDSVVDWRRNLPRIAARFPQLRRELLEGARHGVQNEPGAFRERIDGLLDERLSALVD